MHNVQYGPDMQAPTPDDLGRRPGAAASADLAMFRRAPKWQNANVALTLTLKVKHVDEAVSTRACQRRDHAG